MRGYIAMLAVEKEHRGKGIATKLVSMAVDAMIEKGADEVCTEVLQVVLTLILTSTTDRPGDRDRQHCVPEALRTTGFPTDKEAAQVLPERQSRVPSSPVHPARDRSQTDHASLCRRCIHVALEFSVVAIQSLLHELLNRFLDLLRFHGSFVCASDYLPDEPHDFPFLPLFSYSLDHVRILIHD